ncbi:hypothetical protein SNE40_018036 [Patella caerulea]|uniref:Death-associated protein 1 n=1 Tax=Patella caerulea TaxID=87958 RepID=A0AAN8PHD0_PATCE
MSSTDETELKAGHPPAVKVGGMRVAKTTKPHHEGAAQDDDSEKKSIQPNSTSFLNTQPTTDLDGVVTKGYNTPQHGEHIKHVHEPKQPTHEKRAPNPQINMHINQPR